MHGHEGVRSREGAVTRAQTDQGGAVEAAELLPPAQVRHLLLLLARALFCALARAPQGPRLCERADARAESRRGCVRGGRCEEGEWSGCEGERSMREGRRRESGRRAER